MAKNNSGFYAAFQAKDRRFDGCFYVGISSTGIYCRPVCRAKQPKEENCTFFANAAEAEKEGYRPCLLCRPELAPGMSTTDASVMLAHRAARMLEEKCGSGQSIDEIARKLGCTDRHLRRVFTEEYHVPPVQYLQTCRLLLAKNLLTDTDLPVLEVAMAAGFGSLRRFNDLFQKRYHLSPTALRKRKGADNQKSDHITLALGYRPPYRWEEMLRFLNGRAIAGIETVKNREYLRAVRLTTTDKKTVCGWIRVGNNPKKNVLTVTVSEDLLPVLPQVLARVRHLFDLYCNPDTVYDGLRGMECIRPGLCVLGTRLPGCFDSFEMSVQAILDQQISLKAANTLTARIAEAYGTPVKTGMEGLTHVFPSAKEWLARQENMGNHLEALGVAEEQTKTIYALAEALERGKIAPDHYTHPEEEIKKLMNIQGIERRTAQYIAMRAMGWPDAFPENDAGIKKSLYPRTSKEILQMAQEWRPWRSYAAVNLWNTL